MKTLVIFLALLVVGCDNYDRTLKETQGRSLAEVTSDANHCDSVAASEPNSLAVTHAWYECMKSLGYDVGYERR